ncbi:ETX/MTX2 family pore-forming toxin [Enterococcus hirae]
MKKWLSFLLALLFSMACFSQKAEAGVDLSEAMKKDYNPAELEKYEPGAQRMYDNLRYVLARDGVEETTNWRNRASSLGQHYFITFNYFILPSQEQEILHNLERYSPSGIINLPDLLADLNGYHHSSNKVNVNGLKQDQIDLVQGSQRFISQEDSVIKIPNELINQDYYQSHNYKPQDYSRTYFVGTSATLSHAWSVGTSAKYTLKLGIPGFEHGIELGINASYSGSTASTTTQDTSVTRRAWPVDEIVPPRTGTVVTYEFVESKVKEEYTGKMKVSGLYEDQVNSSPTVVNLGVYTKFKCIQLNNPTIWNKLKELGFDVDDNDKKVIFNGKITVERPSHENLYRQIVRSYYLKENGQIDYSRPIGNERNTILVEKF